MHCLTVWSGAVTASNISPNSYGKENTVNMQRRQTQINVSFDNTLSFKVVYCKWLYRFKTNKYTPAKSNKQQHDHDTTSNETDQELLSDNWVDVFRS